MILYGFGGHGRVVADCLESAGDTVTAVFDDNLSLEYCPFPFFGAYNPDVEEDEQIILAIGNNNIRRKLAGIIRHKAGSTRHPSVIISKNAYTGEGTVLLQRAIVQSGAIIGRHCIINSGAIVEHDASIGDFVHIAPAAIICGGVEVGAGTLIGAGAVLTPGVKVGNDCVIGAGSVVVSSVADGAVLAGNPAKKLK